MAAAAASSSLPPRTQHLSASPPSQLLAVPIKTRQTPRARLNAMVRSPAAPTPTPRSPAAPNPNSSSPAAPNPTPRSQAAPTPTPSSPAADLEEHKVTNELLRAIKNEKANDPDLEEHKGAGELLTEPPKCKKRKRSRQSSGKLHGEHQETNKVVMKPSTSKKKRKASEGMCTNTPAPLFGPLAVDMDKQPPPLKKKRLNKRDVATIPSSGSLSIDKDRQPSPGSLPVDKDKQPSPGPLAVDKDKQPSPGSLPLDNNTQPSSGSLAVDKNKHPSLSKKVVRSPVLNNVVVSFLARREKRPSH
ncbi:neurofilament medium polypeptide-like isoform X1 [Triticum urartu]|uniref:neurofilament medium polypeptide-like isoform X1 n=1 Tax=Triticum urartu TaxID=4572 RepID=UPI0020448905|nr:neurofilament medium polypeptide-like isoform X1 [Triticum urartu]